MLEWLLSIIKTEVPVPKPYGIYHICALAVIIAICVIFTRKVGSLDEASFRRLALAVWLVIAAMELLKQTIYSFYPTDGGIVTDYQWFVFPFQFCSTPYYALPFIIFLPDGFVRRCFIAFFTCFSLFAGLVVMIYPGDVYCATLFINIQTMIHHGSMVAIGALLVAHNRKHMNYRYFAGSLSIFYVFAIVALILNEIFASRDGFNMFFISRHYPCTLPLLSNVYAAVPYGVYLLVYFIGFSFASALIFFTEKGILKLINRLKSR